RAPADEPVVRVQAGRTSYEYVASALRTIVRTEDYLRFGIDGRRATQALRIAPKDRAELVAKVAQLAKDAGFLAANAYRGGGVGTTSVQGTALFLAGSDVNFAPRIRLGDGTICTHDERTLASMLVGHGLYRPIPTTPDRPSLRLAVLHALAAPLRPVGESFV